MDANKLNLHAIIEAIANDDFVVTGLLPTGEVTIAILTDIEQKALKSTTTENVNQMIQKLRDAGQFTHLEFKSAFQNKLNHF
ncbi:hypothetical protein FCT18_14540 [Lysinibacillus sphaericus]|uniref:Uncharacterized protein n=1 Tax=Lysinibacillus sphaericus TaxID=1421 RepID=A0A2S0K6C7_LYSSH|nr:hypothetical protein [Lysinibacillus sphaericus]AVK98886.1 hypothetical protein LS41612_22630 [Lysinibacillus sphaericus]MED4545251.1 hypothetical protein [Lysinibacillus sphaericus]TKI18313.1 hypothetical protein FCT18_14540 [Lysinibacillus sphaericus]GEC82244.1 hypothetical protein LSP03_19870 [Lysinibacillus sphaericus]